MLALVIATISLSGGERPLVELDLPAALARQENTIHLFVRGLDQPAQIDFERALLVKRVVALNAPSTTRGQTTRVEKSDFAIASPQPLVLRLTMAIGSAGRFSLGSIRIRVKSALYEDEIFVELFADPAMADLERRADLVAEAARIGALPKNFAQAMVTPASRALLASCLKEKEFTLALDPGHDDSDPGATSVSGIPEAKLNDRAVARVKTALGDVPGLRVVLTRGPGVALPLPARVRRVERLAPDLLISIHHDSVRAARQRPTLVDERTLLTCGDRAGFALYVPMTGAHALASYQAARYLAANLLAAGRPVGRFFAWGEPRFGIYNGALLYLLDNLERPALLFELGFVCSLAEERWILDERQQAAHAELIAGAILRYVLLSHCHGVRMLTPWVVPPLVRPPAL